MNCQTVQILLPFAMRPGELGTEDTAALNAHLLACPTCAAVACAEKSFDSSVGRAMQVAVPGGLRAEIDARLDRAAPRPIRRPWLQVSAAAAVIFIASSLIWWGNHKVDIHLEAISGDFEGVLASVGSQASAEQFEAYFHDRGLKVKVPDDFDLTALAFFDIVPFEGHEVAHLDFQRGEARAHMFFLPKRHFRLQKDALLKVENSHSTIELIDAPGDSFVLVVYCNGATRAHFQKTAIVG